MIGLYAMKEDETGRIAELLNLKSGGRPCTHAPTGNCPKFRGGECMLINARGSPTPVDRAAHSRVGEVAARSSYRREQRSTGVVGLKWQIRVEPRQNRCLSTGE
jgi:uncharacterized heparinase superfamily protein